MGGDDADTPQPGKPEARDQGTRPGRGRYLRALGFTSLVIDGPLAIRSLRRAHLPGRAVQSVARAMVLLLAVGGFGAPKASVFAVEPPNALTDLLRGKTPQEMYATLKREQCLTVAAVQKPDAVITLIEKRKARQGASTDP